MLNQKTEEYLESQLFVNTKSDDSFGNSLGRRRGKKLKYSIPLTVFDSMMIDERKMYGKFSRKEQLLESNSRR